VAITLIPLNANFFNIFITYIEVDESRPVVGSSKNIILGSVNNSIPIDVRFLSPPEIPFTKPPPIGRSAHFCKPRSSINVSIIVARLSSEYLLFFNFKVKSNDSIYFLNLNIN
jgi:hypothetical protein